MSSWLTNTLLLLLPAGLAAQERVAAACAGGAEPAELRGTPACVRFLADRPEVIPERIGVMGLSQGGQTAPIAAAGSDSVAFVIDVGAAVPFIENVRYEMLQTFREEGLSAARRLEATFEAIEHRDWTVRVFQGLGHALWDTSGPMSEHGLDAEVRRTLVSWVRRVVG